MPGASSGLSCTSRKWQQYPQVHNQFNPRNGFGLSKGTYLFQPYRLASLRIQEEAKEVPGYGYSNGSYWFWHRLEGQTAERRPLDLWINDWLQCASSGTGLDMARIVLGPISGVKTRCGGDAPHYSFHPVSLSNMGVPPIANALRKTAKLRDVEFCLPVPTPTLNILYY